MELGLGCAASRWACASHCGGDFEGISRQGIRQGFRPKCLYAACSLENVSCAAALAVAVGGQYKRNGRIWGLSI